MTVADRLTELGITLPTPPAPVAIYMPLVRVGPLLHLSGHLSRREGAVVRGCAGDDLDADAAAECARLATLELLATIGSAGLLEQIGRVIRLTGYVHATADFEGHSAVINGASQTLIEILGEQRGRHARSAIGVASLPLGAAVEVEAIVELA